MSWPTRCLTGDDPELELEALGISQQAYGQVQTSYNRNQSPWNILSMACRTRWRGD